jgi:hypothetical protein
MCPVSNFQLDSFEGGRSQRRQPPLHEKDSCHSQYHRKYFHNPLYKSNIVSTGCYIIAFRFPMKVSLLLPIGSAWRAPDFRRLAAHAHMADTLPFGARAGVRVRQFNSPLPSVAAPPFVVLRSEASRSTWGPHLQGRTQRNVSSRSPSRMRSSRPAEPGLRTTKAGGRLM